METNATFQWERNIKIGSEKMKQMGLNAIREEFLRFFEGKEHLRMKSFPLIPQNDNSLLLINSGMAPLKPYFTGEQTPPRKRVTTCQKCIRTPDIERVGKTARHGTFFEMLGNFSFGDYFKEEIIPWAWEFCTKTMELPPEKLYVTVYEEDDETEEIWLKKMGIPADHIKRMGKDDNFWEIGTGPCGPCSEIYFDRGEEHGCGQADCSVGCECDRYVEFWNLVFTQFDSDGKGNYPRLEHPNIDTGMGLERLACIVQGVDNLFEVDTVKNIMLHVMNIAKVKYKESEKSDVSLRVITDHIRSTVFMVCDGVLPSNEGRGYVLRKLLRRGARHGRLLGIQGDFLHEVCDTVIKESKAAYPELYEKRDYIKKVIRLEEEKFSGTIDSGLSILNGYIENSKKEGRSVLNGEDAFRLYDTYGFPLDLTKEVLEEQQMTVDEDAFNQFMKQQKEKSHAARSAAGSLGWSAGSEIDLSAILATQFTGYEACTDTARVVAIMAEGESVVQANDGQMVLVVLDRTPFYGESGGQAGDMGMISGLGGHIEVVETKKNTTGVVMHIGKTVGVLKVDEEVSAKVDEDRRRAIMRAHSSTHLLQKALQEVLGNHIAQSGSLVEPDRVRFDFSHFAPMTQEEIGQVEKKVNEAILAGYTVDVSQMAIDDAKKLGAMALFGEKYGEVVRVVKMGGYSTELCGGTHLDNTAKAGIFKILSEASVAAGIRRIEAVTGSGVLALLQERENLIEETALSLKTNQGEIARRSAQLMAETKELSRMVEKLSAKISKMEMGSITENPKEVAGLRVIAAKVPDASPDSLRALGDEIKEKEPKGVALFATVLEDKISLVCVCGKEAVSAGANAGKIIKEVAGRLGGGGGGRPDSATAGAKDVAKLSAVLEEVSAIVEKTMQ